LRDGRVLRTTATPVGSYNVQQGPGRILTPSLEHGTLCVLDTQGRLLRGSQSLARRTTPASSDRTLRP
jgi:hypothetical protein